MQKPTGLILANGEGSRIQQTCRQQGVPKHLLRVGTETLMSRLTRQLRTACSRVVCVVPEELQGTFRRALPDTNRVDLIPARRKSDYTTTLRAARESLRPDSTVVLTTGDLVFDDKEIQKFLDYVCETRADIVAGIRRAETRRCSVALSSVALPVSVIDEALKNEINPENTGAMISFFVRRALRSGIRISHLPIVANVNTDEDYERLTDSIPRSAY